MNRLYFGDNLEILRELNNERVHLICTDLPFNSGRDYNSFIGDPLTYKKAFTDYMTMGHRLTRRSCRPRTPRLH